MEVVLDRLLRVLPDLVVLTASVLSQIIALVWLLGWRFAAATRRTKSLIAAVCTLSMAASMLTFLLRFHRLARHFPGWWLSWGISLAITWAMLSWCWLAGCLALLVGSRFMSGHSPARRLFLQGA